MQPELEKLQGSWNIVSLELQGSKIKDADFDGAKLVITGDKFTSIGMGTPYGGTIRIDDTVTPKRLDLMFTEGPHRGQASLGVYEVDDDTLKLCLAFAGLPRPNDFATVAGSGHALETLKRE